MGYRFRKSINLGGGFRINLSKSGIGYSWGVPGMRYTKLANERERYTYSIPGTGTSYVEDTSSKENQQQHQQQSANNDTQNSINAIEEKVSKMDFEENSNSDEFINKINKFRNTDANIQAGIVLLSIILFFILTNPIVFIIGLLILSAYNVYRNKKMLISVEYNFDNENEKYYELLNNFLNTIASSKGLWLIETEYKNVDEKRNAGAKSLVSRLPISVTKEVPFYLKINTECYCLNIKDKKFYFLPNKVLIHDKIKTIGLNFQELNFYFGENTFIEEECAPSDSKIIDYTYRFVNKKGGPDRRYKDNPQYPICLYGTIDIKNEEGLNLSILLSSNSKTMQARQLYESLKSINISTTKKCINCGGNISIDANFCKYCDTKQ